MFGEKNPELPFNNGYPGQMMYQDPVGQQRNQQPFISKSTMSISRIHTQNYDWHPLPTTEPLLPDNVPPYGQNYQPGMFHKYALYYQPYSQKDSQFLFQNPLQPQDEIIQKQQYMPMNGYPMMNPYPKQSAMPKQPWRSAIIYEFL